MFLTKLQSSNKKLVHYLDSLKPKKVLFIFDHGLGDYIMYVNIFDYLIKQYPDTEFTLGYNEKFDYGFIHKNTYKLTPKINLNFNELYFAKTVQDKYDIPKLEEEFDIVVDLIFPETPRSMTKMDVCFQYEIGFKNVECPNAGSYKIYKNDVAQLQDSNIVGLHCVTNTGVKMKSLSPEECRSLYTIVHNMGFTPVIFHTKFKASSPEYLAYNFDWVPKRALIDRDNVPDMMTEIAKCKYFIGVLSGPLCLAQNILGDTRCISILKQKYPINTYLHNSKIATIRSVSDSTIKAAIYSLNNLKHGDDIVVKLPNFEENPNLVLIDGELYEKVRSLPKKHPSLPEGLSEQEKIMRLREINRRGIAPPLETKLVKKLVEY
jgi:ADP-heptose:LPS heptosyltransferase